MHQELEYVPRLVVAFALGGAIGWERWRRHKAAGLRTHVLVATACALLMSVSALLNHQVPLAQGILTGIGFIGAGTIIRQEASVVGLTTAGTIWTSAAVGVALGAGFYLLAVTAFLLCYAAISLLGDLERRVERDEMQHRLREQADQLQDKDRIISALTRHVAKIEPAPAPAPQTAGDPPPAHQWWQIWRR